MINLETPIVNLDRNEEVALFALQTVKRGGIEELINYLVDSDYFFAPASTHFHNSFPGGLCFHSVNLMHAFRGVDKKLLSPLPNDSVVICSLLHDLCKVNAYEYVGKDYASLKGPKGHATLSISRIKQYIELTDTEEDIIRYHMGSFGIFVYREHDALSMHKAIMKCPQVQIFAALDMADSKQKKGDVQNFR